MNSLLKTIILSLLFIAAATPTFAQKKAPKVKTSTFTVSGVCGMCEERIENAALIKGVKSAEWDKQTQLLTVIYKPKKVDEKAIHEAVAEYGHDTELVKATDESYNKLPSCCRYRDGVEVH
jgi:mercuric ion binding protein